MQKLERGFVQFFKTNNALKLTPSSLRLFSIDKNTTSETFHEKELTKNVEEKHDISKLEIDTKLNDQSFSIDKNTTSATFHEKELTKNVEEKHDISKLEIDTTLNDQHLKTFVKYAPLNKVKDEIKEASFASLLRSSNLMHLGDPKGKQVIGKIFQVVNNDLYIDFGWKFHCVCPKPMKNTSDYVRGAEVRLKIKDLELSTKFLGFTKDVTLLEADCTLLGLVSTPNKIHKTTEAPETVIEASQ